MCKTKNIISNMLLWWWWYQCFLHEHATQHSLEYDIIEISTLSYQKYHHLKLFIILCSNICTSLTHKQPKLSFFHPHIKCVRGLVLEELLVNNPYFRKMPSVWLDLPRKLQINHWPRVTDQPVELEKQTSWSSRLQEKNWSVWRNLLNIPQINKEDRKDHTIHVTGCTWKHWDFDQFCPNISPDIGAEFLIEAVEVDWTNWCSLFGEDRFRFGFEGLKLWAVLRGCI